MKVLQKYRSQQTIVDGRKFPSKKEASRYQELMQMWRSGEIRYFLPQVSLELNDQGSAKYRCDFLIFPHEGPEIYEDVKGMKTDMYKLKKKLVEARYPIEIKEI